MNTTDVYAEYERVQQTRSYFEKKYDRKSLPEFFGTNLALWAWGELYLQKKTEQKAQRIAEVIA
jgi:hypothetical protein